jgi:hypothetical protein
LLSNAILEVGVNATEGELMSYNVACLLEGIIMKSPIVEVVVLDSDVVLGGALLKSTFVGNCFYG